ncbi:ABC transporter ATP-binding protein [Agrilactobacillus yilanensis]|uniref:ABC transporter ATP-binding protein n=1 Tax=Agrilactobacillus yilanensis TaxID=2485997 RepID=A0ABW4J6N8_9LACO|nr:ABC transporter ATP-binding protein [Agrilactobacillus yilanensis]
MVTTLKPSLALTDITKYYQDGPNRIEVLKSTSLAVGPGEFAAIIGPSGAGKSTLLSIAGTLLSPSSGKIELADTDVTTMPAKDRTKLRLQKVGFIFQNSELIPYLTVKDQLKYVTKLAKRPTSEAEILALLNHLGLSHRLKNFPNQLSGGERQRVAIARAFINNPDLILADEPTASLDSKRGHEVVAMIAQEVHEVQKAAVMVTHDERVLDLVDQVYRIEDGQLKKI